MIIYVYKCYTVNVNVFNHLVTIIHYSVCYILSAKHMLYIIKPLSIMNDKLLMKFESAFQEMYDSWIVCLKLKHVRL